MNILLVLLIISLITSVILGCITIFKSVAEIKNERLQISLKQKELKDAYESQIKAAEWLSKFADDTRFTAEEKQSLKVCARLIQVDCNELYKLISFGVELINHENN